MDFHLPMYSDFNGLASLRAGAAAQKPEALAETARQFEALFVQMMLKSMRDASAVLGEDRDTTYEEMFDRQIAMEMTREKGMGLADVMLQQLAGRAPSDAGRRTTPETPLHLPPMARLGAAASTRSTPRLPAYRDFRPESPEDFIRGIWAYAQRAAHRLGTEARALIAQAALETGWGEKMMRNTDGTNSNNLFGIKADHRWQGDRLAVRSVEYTDGTPRRQTSQFRSYSSLAEGFADYVDFLQNNPRYGFNERMKLDANDYVRRLQSAGYATDPKYAEKIQGIMNSNRLEETIRTIKVNTGVPNYL